MLQWRGNTGVGRWWIIFRVMLVITERLVHGVLGDDGNVGGLGNVGFEGESIGDAVFEDFEDARINVVVGFGSSRGGDVDGEDTLVTIVRQDATMDVGVSRSKKFG